MSHYYFKQRNADAERKLQKILNEPERRAKEQQFAANHEHDTDEELLSYVKQQKQTEGNRFKRTHLIGYRYLVHRFGSWQNVITIVNQEIKNEKTN